MFAAIKEKTLYIFAICNFAAIVIVWALYPETANRTLEEIDSLFSAKWPWAWQAEKAFADYKQHHLTYSRAIREGSVDVTRIFMNETQPEPGKEKEDAHTHA